VLQCCVLQCASMCLLDIHTQTFTHTYIHTQPPPPRHTRHRHKHRHRHRHRHRHARTHKHTHKHVRTLPKSQYIPYMQRRHLGPALYLLSPLQLHQTLRCTAQVALFVFVCMLVRVESFSLFVILNHHCTYTNRLNEERRDERCVIFSVHYSQPALHIGLF